MSVLEVVWPCGRFGDGRLKTLVKGLDLLNICIPTAILAILFIPPPFPARLRVLRSLNIELGRISWSNFNHGLVCWPLPEGKRVRGQFSQHTSTCKVVLGIWPCDSDIHLADPHRRRCGLEGLFHVIFHVMFSFEDQFRLFVKRFSAAPQRFLSRPRQTHGTNSPIEKTTNSYVVDLSQGLLIANRKPNSRVNSF